MTPAQAAEHALSHEATEPSGSAQGGDPPPKRTATARHLDPVLMLGVSLALGGVLVTHPEALAVACATLLLVSWRYTSLALRCFMLCLVLVGGARAVWQVELHEQAWLAARAWVTPGARCVGHGEVLRSPTVRGERLSMLALLELECDERKLPGTFKVRLYGGPDELGRGDQLRVNAQLSPVQILRNLELPDPRPGAARGEATLSGSVLALELRARGSGLAHTVDQFRAHARRRILATFDPLASPMARALVLGENDLNAEDDEAFRKSGLSHLLAVSGTHLVFAVVSLVTALQALLLRLPFISARFCVSRLAAAVGCPLALLYADYAGGSGSAWRAAFMLCAVFAARAVFRRAGPARSLGWSLLAGAAVDPLVAYDVSFLLSAAATVGLVCIGSPALAWAERRAFTQNSKVLSYLVASVVATVGSMLPCAPLLAILSPDLTLAGIAANVVAAPLGEIIALPLCLAHALVGAVPPLEHGMAKAAGGALLVVRQVAHWSADARSLAFAVPPPTAWHLLALGGCGAAAIIAAWQGNRRASGTLALAAVCLVVLAEARARGLSRPRGELRVAQLDVGQGDAALVDLPDGRLMLIDAGGSATPQSSGQPGFDPGRRVILPVLRARRRARIDIVVLTHPHPDHYAGLHSVVKEAVVAELWDSGFPGGNEYNALLKQVSRVRKSPELCAAPLGGPGYQLEVLGPCPVSPEFGANDNSLVLRITSAGRALLFTGDAEAPQEAQLSQLGDALKADYLKAGHHGSNTSSSSELLSAVAPSLVGISCGVRNQFGHPHPEAMERMRAAGAALWRIDDRGSLELTLKGGELEYTGFDLAGAPLPLGAHQSLGAPQPRQTPVAAGGR